MKDLSIIIVNYRCWDKLSQCLTSLVLIPETAFSFEVIVVDNASKDGCLFNFIQLYQQFKFISSPGNWGFANGNNLGAANACGKYLLFLNPDTIVCENALTQMIQVAKISSPTSIISCRQIRQNGREDKPYGVFPSPMTLMGWTRALAKLLHLNNHPVQNENFIFPDWVSGSVLLISKESFISIGGWNERFWMYYEDVDLCQRARIAGGNALLLKSVSVIHNHGGSSRSDPGITVMTKTEVNISQHEYISLHAKGLKEILMHGFLIFNNVVLRLVPALTGLILHYNKSLSIETKIYLKLLNYYFNALLRYTWISPRSVVHPDFYPYRYLTDKNLISLSDNSPERA